MAMKNHDRDLESVAWDLYYSLTDGAEKVKVLTLLFKLRGPSRQGDDQEVDVADQTKAIVEGINARRP